MAAGNEFSIIVSINNCFFYLIKENDETEVFGCGHNL